MYNKNNLAVAKVASKSRIRPELACVAFYGNRTIATDSFRLIEMSATGKKKETPTLYYAKDVKKIKEKMVDDDSMPIKAELLHGDSYPKVDILLDKEPVGEYVKIKVNAEYLAEICLILKTLDPYQAIMLNIPTTNISSPIYITAESPDKQKARAILMPMTY